MTISRSVADTISFGAQLATSLHPGDVVALSGDLGAGKTCLVKGFALGLGVTQDVTSPTYTIIHEYRGGRLPLAHVDLYRLDTMPQAIATGIEEYLNGDCVTVIEWAEKIATLLPEHAKRIRIEVVDETTRRIEVA